MWQQSCCLEAEISSAVHQAPLVGIFQWTNNPPLNAHRIFFCRLAPQFRKVDDVGDYQTGVVSVLPLNPRGPGVGMLIGKIQPFRVDLAVKHVEDILQIRVFSLGRNPVGEDRERIQIVFSFSERLQPGELDRISLRRFADSFNLQTIHVKRCSVGYLENLSLVPLGKYHAFAFIQDAPRFAFIV